MSLKPKIFSILVAVLTLYAVTDQLVQRNVVLPEFFTQLEEREAAKDIERVQGAIEREVEELRDRSRDWARWDDTCRFVELAVQTGEPDPAFVAANLADEALDEAKIHLLFFCDTEGNVLWHRIRDPEGGAPLKLREFPSQQLQKDRGLMAHAGLQDDRSGILMTGDRTLLVSSRPIVSTRGVGPARGVVIAGRFLSTDVVQEIGQRYKVQFSHWPLFGSELPPSVAAIKDRVTSSIHPVIETLDDDWMHVYAQVVDYNQQPALLIRAEVKREIAARGSVAMRYAFLSTIAAALLLLLVLMGLLERTVLAPIAKLTDHALAVGKTDDTYARLASDRPDEIGILSREFDDMLEKLGKSRQAVVETARAAGMSEIATGVLHNVGNVLNSVNVSATMVAQKVRATALGDLERVVEVMDQHAADLPGFLGKDPRGKHLHPFLKSLTAKLAEERAALEREVHGLTEGIDHVKVLVKAQQTYARRTEVLEPTILAEQIEAALGISYQVLPKREDLVVERELEDLPRVNVDRHKLMEILVNVIINARQSMAESGCAPPILRLSVAKVDDERVQIRIADNGLGIPPENLVNIFKHGFTTKKNGHGFGLHTAANAATEMSGGLRAESDGPGKGATFVLEIPFRTARELAKAS